MGLLSGPTGLVKVTTSAAAEARTIIISNYRAYIGNN